MFSYHFCTQRHAPIFEHLQNIETTLSNLYDLRKFYNILFILSRVGWVDLTWSWSLVITWRIIVIKKPIFLNCFSFKNSKSMRLELERLWYFLIIKLHFSSIKRVDARSASELETAFMKTYWKSCWVASMTRIRLTITIGKLTVFG